MCFFVSKLPIYLFQPLAIGAKFSHFQALKSSTFILTRVKKGCFEIIKKGIKNYDSRETSGFLFVFQKKIIVGTDYGHTKDKSLILCGPNSSPNPNPQINIWDVDIKA